MKSVILQTQVNQNFSPSITTSFSLHVPPDSGNFTGSPVNHFISGRITLSLPRGWGLTLGRLFWNNQGWAEEEMWVMLPASLAVHASKFIGIIPGGGENHQWLMEEGCVWLCVCVCVLSCLCVCVCLFSCVCVFVLRANVTKTRLWCPQLSVCAPASGYNLALSACYFGLGWVHSFVWLVVCVCIIVKSVSVCVQCL